MSPGVVLMLPERSAVRANRKLDSMIVLCFSIVSRYGKLEELLEKSFPLVKMPSIQPVVMQVLKHLPKVSSHMKLLLRDIQANVSPPGNSEVAITVCSLRSGEETRLELPADAGDAKLSNRSFCAIH